MTGLKGRLVRNAGDFFMEEKNKIVLRELRITDLPALHRLYAGLSEEGKCFYHPHYFLPKTGIKWLLSMICFSLSTFGGLRKILMKVIPNAVFLSVVALDKSKIIGLCYLKLKARLTEGYRSDFGIMVAERYHGRGIGSRLVEAILKMARENNVYKIDLEVLQDNKSAFRLYQKYGFKVTGSIPKREYWRGKHYDIQQMSNILKL